MLGLGWQLGIVFWVALLQPGPGSLEDLERSIRNQIAGQETVYGIAFRRLDTGESLAINADDEMHAASTMKVPVMMRLFEMIESGSLGLESKVVVKNQFRSIVDGSSYAISDDSDQEIYNHLGSRMTVSRLLERMIVVSSNLATNLLIELADAEKIMILMSGIGAKGVRVLRGVEDLKAYRAGLNNRCSAGAMLSILEACVGSSRFSPKSREQMIAILRQQHYQDMIPKGLPEDSGAVVANKTGSISTVEHDAAIVDLPDGRRYLLVIFSRDFAGEKGRTQVHTTAQNISRQVYNYMMADGS